MAELYSAKYVFLAAALMNALGACLSPLMAFWDFKALIAVRVMQGLGGVSKIKTNLYFKESVKEVKDSILLF